MFERFLGSLSRVLRRLRWFRGMFWSPRWPERGKRGLPDAAVRAADEDHVLLHREGRDGVARVRERLQARRPPADLRARLRVRAEAGACESQIARPFWARH